MKKIILLILAIGLVSCGPSKTVKDSKKTMKGEWTLSSITYGNTGTYDVILLNDASKECFEGSTWAFIPNNNSGTYTINHTACTTGDRHFIFTIQEVNAETGLYDFLLKPTNKRGKSEDNHGFRFKLSALSGTAMQWQQSATVEGKPFTINMNFTKL